MTQSEILRQAATALEEFGFARFCREIHPWYHSIHPEHGKVGAMCALGALNHALVGDAESEKADHHPVIQTLVEKLSLVDNPNITPYLPSVVADWSNTAPSAKTVIDAFRRVADQIEAE